MDIPEAFILKLLGTKFEIVPYHPKGTTRRVRYHIKCRHFAPPTSTDFIATPHDLRALRAWLDVALAMNPPE